MNGFDIEIYVATVATATIIINYANDVAGVWDRVLQDYPKTDLTPNGLTRTATVTELLSDSESTSSCGTATSPRVLFKFDSALGVPNATVLKHSGVRNSVALLLIADNGVDSTIVLTDASVLRRTVSSYFPFPVRQFIVIDILTVRHK